MRLLVTGASGFIGQSVLAHLADRKIETHGVAIPPFPEKSGVTWHNVNLLSPGSARQLIDQVRPTHILHLAWTTEHGVFWDSPQNLAWVRATTELMEAFSAAGGQRFVGAGTCAEYDWGDGYCSERTTPLEPATLYGAAKDATRRLLSAYADGAGFSWAWGRVFLLFGPGEVATRLVPATILSLLRGEPTRCSSGNQRRDFLPVREVARAFVAVLDSDLVGAVNIASGEPRSVREVVSTIAELIGRPKLALFGALPDRDEAQLIAADVTRLTDEVGLDLDTSLTDALQETIQWWQTRLK